MFCSKCGKELNSTAENCPYCGAPVEAKEAQVIEQTPQAEHQNVSDGGENAQPQGQYYSTAPEYEAPKQDFNAPHQDYFFSNIPDDIDRSSVSKKEYINKYAPANLRKSINSISIACYVLCGISIIGGLIMGSGWYVLIDAVILLAPVLGMHIAKSKVCAVILLVISIIECVLTSVMIGTVAGWWWIIASISAVSAFRKIDKEYNSFLLGGNPAYNASENSGNVK